MNEYETLLTEYLETIDKLEKRIHLLERTNTFDKDARVFALKGQVWALRESARMIQRYVKR